MRCQMLYVVCDMSNFVNRPCIKSMLMPAHSKSMDYESTCIYELKQQRQQQQEQQTNK